MKLPYKKPVKVDGRTLEVTDANDVVIVPSILYKGDYYHVEGQKVVAAILVTALNDAEDEEADPKRTEKEPEEEKFEADDRVPVKRGPGRPRKVSR